MVLSDLLSRKTPPTPFDEFDNIPWFEPAFSERMLEFHLDQSNDLASRREEIIEAQVTWIHKTVCREAPYRILDLGCGPGLYANRLGSIGHTVHGIDYSPASIAHARAHQARGVSFVEGDVRTASFDAGYDLAMMIYGEFNVFSHEQVAEMLSRIAAALVPGATLLLEINSISAMKSLADTPARIDVLESGLFSDRPHLYLEEAFWEDFDGILTKRYTIIDLASADYNEYGTSYQTWTDAELSTTLEAVGFGEMTILPEMGVDAGFDGFIVVATKS
jgi:SAM-dependent methyltransferase